MAKGNAAGSVTWDKITLIQHCCLQEERCYPSNTGTLTHCNELQINRYVIPAGSKGCCRVEGCGGGCPTANSTEELPHFTWEKEFQNYSTRSAWKAPFPTYAVLAISPQTLTILDYFNKQSTTWCQWPGTQNPQSDSKHAHFNGKICPDSHPDSHGLRVRLLKSTHDW